MVSGIATALYAIEEALIVEGHERLGLSIGFVADLIAGQVPLVWRAWRGQLEA